jgi:hypothetical protein
VEHHTVLVLGKEHHTGPGLDWNTAAVAHSFVAAEVAGYIAAVVNNLLGLGVESLLGRLDSLAGERQ